jgi:hypothetical protein
MNSNLNNYGIYFDILIVIIAMIVVEYDSYDFIV